MALSTSPFLDAAERYFLVTEETVALSADREITVQSKYGVNIVSVKEGKIAVTEADCPDHYCMDRGWCNSGAQIVCLPNRLVLEFTGEQTIDGLTG